MIAAFDGNGAGGEDVDVLAAQDRDFFLHRVHGDVVGFGRSERDALEVLEPFLPAVDHDRRALGANAALACRQADMAPGDVGLLDRRFGIRDGLEHDIAGQPVAQFVLLPQVTFAEPAEFRLRIVARAGDRVAEVRIVGAATPGSVQAVIFARAVLGILPNGVGVEARGGETLLFPAADDIGVRGVIGDDLAAGHQAVIVADFARPILPVAPILCFLVRLVGRDVLEKARLRFGAGQAKSLPQREQIGLGPRVPHVVRVAVEQRAVERGNRDVTVERDHAVEREIAARLHEIDVADRQRRQAGRKPAVRARVRAHAGRDPQCLAVGPNAA